MKPDAPTMTSVAAPPELIRAIAIVAKGGRALSDDIAREIAAERLSGGRSLVEDLGPRETEILRLIASGWTKTVIFIVVAPVMGFVLGFGMMVIVYWIFRRQSPRQVDKLFRRLQLLSAAAYSLGHGGNDAQKTMGIVAGALYTAGVMRKEDFAANWGAWHWPIILAANLAIALGTYFGGWRIVRTMGSKITHLTPMQGFCAETGGAGTLFLATWLGIPVSTTHTITGAIVGVGAARRLSAVRWNVASSIVFAWIVTLPAAAFVAALFYVLATLVA